MMEKSLSLDIELYQHSSCLLRGKENKLFEKKSDIGIKLIDRSLNRCNCQGIVLIVLDYGNNITFIKKLEYRVLSYNGIVAKNQKIIIN